MKLAPFPAVSVMRWRRLDVPGNEEARAEQVSSGWLMTGELSVEEAGVPARLRYRIECAPDWRTRSALIEGRVSEQTVRFALSSDGAGHWTQDGRALPHLTGALDVDLGFTPATNLLPIRRLDLAEGAEAKVVTAWLRFPELRLERLDQAYSRVASHSYRYVAYNDDAPFTALLEVDSFGRVILYEGLWEAESAVPVG